MNSRTDIFIISRHAFKIIFPLGILTLLLLLFVGFEIFTFALLLIFAFALYIHRNPERISHFAQDSSILSPVDGKVKKIVSIDKSPVDGKPGFEIIIESGYMDVAVLRSPSNSNMSIDFVKRGAMLGLKSPLSVLNESASIRFSSEYGDILVKHTLGSWARPLYFGVEGEILQNQRYGFMLNGVSSIYLPSNSRIGIKEGMTLRAGESLVGYFSEPSK